METAFFLFWQKKFYRTLIKFYNILKNNILHTQNKFQKNSQTIGNKKIICNFATLTFQILSNGLRKVWDVGKKRVKIEVPEKMANRVQKSSKNIR